MSAAQTRESSQQEEAERRGWAKRGDPDRSGAGELAGCMVCALSSGAQTSVDRAALDWAIFRDIPHSGLRFQSEVEGLRWSDVDWAESRFTVHEKKVEHHPGRVPRKSGTNSVTKKRGGHHGRAKGGHRGVR